MKTLSRGWLRPKPRSEVGIVATNTKSLVQLHQQRTTGFLIVLVELPKLSEVTTVVAVLEVDVRTVKSVTKRA
jgi:hypothetical protein